MKQLTVQLKRAIFWKIYHRQAANFKDSDQNIEYMFGEIKQVSSNR